MSWWCALLDHDLGEVRREDRRVWCPQCREETAQLWRKVQCRRCGWGRVAVACRGKWHAFSR